MKLQFRLPILAILMVISHFLHAQNDTHVNFDKITVNDFSLQGIDVDTSYGAVVLADVGKSSFIANKKGFFSLVFKYQRRVKILHQKAFDIATVKIPLYSSVKTDSEEILESLKATTYNIVDGKIVATDLEKSNVYKEVLDKNHSVRKFTMPAIKEGSIIDISYTITSDFLFNLQPWIFQGSYPRLWSEYNLNLPSFFEYVFLRSGGRDFDIKETKEKSQSYMVRLLSENPAYLKDDLISLYSKNTISRWAMKNVPALKEEPFTSSLNNHLSRIEFQLSGQQFPDMPHEDIMGSWSKACLELMKNNNFGGTFQNDNKWVTDALSTLPIEGKEPIEKAKEIYTFLQKNIASRGINDIYLSQTLKETFLSKKGYVQDINLLLILFLKKAGMRAFPVLVSTKANGLATQDFPILNQYNYVISKVEIGDKSFYLDASKSYLGFGKLPSYCYNGAGALVDFLSTPEPLYADSITEKKVTNVSLFNNEKNKNEWIGSLISSLGYYESCNIKEDIQEKGKTAFEKKLSDSYNNEFSIDNIKINELENNEKPLLVNYAIKVDRAQETDIIYFNPMLNEGIKENYFKAADRKYPVELTSKMDETYMFSIQIPEGFVIDETPKSTKVSLFETDGSFEYLISKTDESVSLTTRLKLNKTVFMDDEYESLRSFLDFVVKKHAEQIVFKKKS